MKLFHRTAPATLDDAELDVRRDKLQTRTYRLAVGFLGCTAVTLVALAGMLSGILAPAVAFAGYVPALLGAGGTLLFRVEGIKELEKLKAEKERRVTTNSFSPPPGKPLGTISGTFDAATVSTGQNIKVRPLKLNLPGPGNRLG